MHVVLNGEPSEIPDNSTIADLLDSMAIGRERVAVEVNREIVPKSSHATRLLCDGDEVELVHAMGGG